MFGVFRLVLAAFLLSSSMFLACSTNPTEPVPPHPTPVMPLADTPAHAVDAFRWAMENRSFDSYRTLFTDDFVFEFAALDTSGNAYRNDAWTREDELLSFRHLTIGGGVRSPASRVTLVLDRTFLVKPDPRPGKDSVKNKLVVSQCNLTVQITDGSAMNVNGKLGLYLVRGDAAVLPADLGRAPDSTAWYVERWEDNTFAPALVSAGRTSVAAAQPSMSWTWGSLKALYLPSAPPALASAARP